MEQKTPTEVEYSIAPAALEDCEEVAALDAVCMPDPWSAENFRQLVKSPAQRCLVAKREGEIIGFAGLMVTPDTADITTVGVAPNWRRQGLGRKLLDALFAIASGEGCEKVFLEVRAGNAGALALYEGYGFEVISRRKKYYTSPVEDAIIMQRKVREND